MSDRDNVVSLSDRLAALKSRTAEESEEAKQNDFVPTEADITTFLMVLRHLQKNSASNTADIECGAEFLSMKIIESVSDELTNRAMFFDVKQKARVVTFDFPWHILDVDRSILTRDDAGKDVIDLFSGAVCRWVKDIAISH